MSITLQKPSGVLPSITSEILSVKRQVLAFDALSKLTRQFADKPDFHHLINAVILTIVGQFTVTKAFAVIYDSRGMSEKAMYFGTGKLHKNPELKTLVREKDSKELFDSIASPQLIDDLQPEPAWNTMGRQLEEHGVKLLVPMLQGEKLIGVIGLSDKVTRKPFEQADIELLTTLANTITPLLVNSFLFTEIRNVNDWYLDLLDNIKQGVFVFDSDNKLKEINSAALQILRYLSPDDNPPVILHGGSVEGIFPESEYPGWARQLLKARNEEHSKLIERLLAVGPEGDRIFNVRISIIREQAGSSSDLIITLDDVTAQKDNEMRMFDLEKYAEKGIMASSIAHDLNNFLGLILGGVEISQMSLAKGNTEKVEKYLDKLKSHVGKMERFTSGLMEHARLNAEKRTASLNTVVSDVLSFANVQKRFKGIIIERDLDLSIPVFPIDTDQLAQLLLNFLNNAADAIAETGRKDGRIVVKTEATDEMTSLSISDNGTGIKPDDEERLFRTHFTTKENGHGYGLVTCQKIIEAHKVEVVIDTELGNGTEFTLKFPIEQDSE